MSPPPALSLGEAAAGRWEVVVAGAGPAGALAARQLARAGLSVLLVDKASFPREKVCGCCVSGAALRTLDAAGLGDLVARHGGVPLARVCLAVAGRSADLPLPGGRALSRPAFDTALVAAAVEAGASFFPQTFARSFRSQPTGAASVRRVLLRQGGHEITVAARVLLAADGLSGRVLADEPGCAPVAAAGSRIGAGAVAPAAPPFFGEGTIYMACGEGGYVGLVRLEDGRLDVAAALDPWLVRRHRGPGGAVAALLARVDWPAVPDLPALDWRGTVALTRRRARLAGPRFFVLGDAAGYVEPFTGEGMAWALAQAVAVAPLAAEAARHWHPGLERRWCAVHRQLLGGRARLCRAVTLALRRPRLVRLAVAALSRMPFLAAPLVRRLQM